MKIVLTTIVLMLAVLPASAQSKYGLSCHGDSCSAVDQKAEERIIDSKSICSSGDTGFTYSKKNPPSQIEERLYWQDINAAQAIAELDYRTVYDCSKADLILRINLDTTLDQVLLTVTDADSGEAVFTETRSIQDKRNDLFRAAKHFREAVATAKRSLQERQEAVEEAKRERERAVEEAKPQNKCKTTVNSLRQRIALQSNEPSLLQTLIDEIQTYNRTCPNDPINSEIIARLEKVQDKAAKEKALQDQNAAHLEKSKTEALAAYQQRLATTAFVPPVEGWVRAASLPTASFYIIAPTGPITAKCHFAADGSKSALDCLGAERNDYFAVQNDGRWYLLKSKRRIADGEYASTLKDGGLTVCLRKAGCYRVLAEVRQPPTALPDRLQIQVPGALTQTYSNDDLSFNYPQNWQVEERKRKDNSIGAVDVYPSDAKLGSWVTYGFFVGRYSKYSSEYPQTLDGASDLFLMLERQRGLTVAAPKTAAIGDSQGRIATYTSPSVLNSGENGWLIVVKDKNEGFYWIELFSPSNDESRPYAQIFNDILKSFKFKK